MRSAFFFALAALLLLVQVEGQIFEQDDDGSGWGDENGSGIEPQVSFVILTRPCTVPSTHSN